MVGFRQLPGLTFEVIEGGFLDIDVRVTGPEGEEIITRERESNGKITFAAARTGAYTYCFSNKMSTMTPKGGFLKSMRYKIRCNLWLC